MDLADKQLALKLLHKLLEVKHEVDTSLKEKHYFSGEHASIMADVWTYFSYMCLDSLESAKSLEKALDIIRTLKEISESKQDDFHTGFFLALEMLISLKRLSNQGPHFRSAWKKRFLSIINEDKAKDLLTYKLRAYCYNCSKETLHLLDDVAYDKRRPNRYICSECNSVTWR